MKKTSLAFSLRFRLLFLIALAAFSMACGAPYKVINQAEPNPFHGAKKFVVKAIDFSKVRIGERTEEQYKADKSERQEGSFEGDKQGMNEVFFQNLKETAADNQISVEREPGDPNTFVIVPIVTFIEPGFYAAVVSKPSKVVMTLKILSPNGNSFDEIEIEHESRSTMTNPSSGQRLRADAEWMGGVVGDYVTKRAYGEN